MKPDLSLKLTQKRRIWIPYFVLGITLVITSLATYYAAKTSEDKDQLRFENAVQRTQDDIQNRLDTYIAMLRATSGLWVVNESVSREQFRTYVNHLELPRRYPGIRGIGFSKRVMPEEKEALVSEMRRQGVENFTLQPEFERSEYHTIIYMEPLDRRNQAAFGFDMFTEPVRRVAMESARDMGAPAASGRVTLVQEIDPHKQAGFVIYVPVYRNGLTPDTVSERQATLEGFIYSPFRGDDLMRGIFGTEKYPFVNFAIYDGTTLTPENLLHRSKGDNSSYQPRFQAIAKIDVAGRSWSILFKSRPELDLTSGRSLVPYIAVGGLLVSFVLFGVTRSQACARNAAEQAAADLRSSEKALRKSEERFQAFMNHNPAAAWITDKNGRILYVNETYFHLFKQLTADAIGKTIFDIYPTEFASVLLESIRTVANTHQVSEAIESILRSDGTIGDFLVYKFPLSDTSRQSLVAGVAIDITERKQAEREREQLLIREQTARAQAEAANRIKDEFLAILSHELRTPLNPILGWVKLLRTRKFDEGTKAKALETIERNAKLQTQLIEDLLDVSRILRGKLSLNISSVDLVLAIEAAIETVSLAAQAKSIKIQTAFDPTVGQVKGDFNRLQQVVWNLLSNAVKFTPAGGRVEVRLEPIEPRNLIKTRGVVSEAGELDNSHLSCVPVPLCPCVQITVSDTGKGINPEFLPHVFDYFRQENSSTTRVFGGLGLGLAIVHHLVELHGGTVEAASAGEEQGATFTVTLPLFEESKGAAPLGSGDSGESDRTLPSHRSPLTGLRILVVDDEVDTRELTVFTLEQHGAVVTAVGSAIEALKALALEKPDLLLSDIGMPQMDGYMLMRQIRSLPPEQGGQIPAIALTAYAGEVDYKLAIKAGFQKHITKPVEPVELVTVIINLIKPQTP
ncbi:MULTISPECIES: CHASE domain-containing protein [unclassified Coleofasciculus]|uniref:CHASE domain-containing protein n=1 Tax=unclassified Coleofasciculus TaxID=2692782 RepID=UPI00187E4AE6|nr:MULTISPECIES: CHASE domain-containing protein [unclassified Coleofasciculus]MBE9125675.1 CHASE domain-containing protein [Coleofasciculus sp. LEGE 07081]MBE9148830.1 CHASE domain-containing protein [Coleofasciculus sp. LEGE 07092]